MSAKKSRTLLTVGGMAIGFGVVVFLLSIGYSSEKLVKDRVATLNEVSQISFTTQDQSVYPLNKEFLDKVSNIQRVKNVMLMISIVGEVNYNNSLVDFVVYSAESDYLKYSDLTLLSGEYYPDSDSWKKEFNNSSLINFLNENTEDVLGIATENVSKESHTISKTETGYLNLRSSPSLTAPVLDKINSGTVVEVLSEQKDAEENLWYDVRHNNVNKAWGFADYIEAKEEGSVLAAVDENTATENITEELENSVAADQLSSSSTLSLDAEILELLPELVEDRVSNE